LLVAEVGAGGMVGVFIGQADGMAKFMLSRAEAVAAVGGFEGSTGFKFDFTIARIMGRAMTLFAIWQLSAIVISSKITCGESCFIFNYGVVEVTFSRDDFDRFGVRKNSAQPIAVYFYIGKYYYFNHLKHSMSPTR